MSSLKKLVILLLIVLFLFVNISVVLATEESEEIVEEFDSQPLMDVVNMVNQEDDVVQESSTDPSSLSTFSPSTVTSVSSLDNYAQANLSMSNILSIILISIGILLILFAIAILIRLKSER